MKKLSGTMTDVLINLAIETLAHDNGDLNNWHDWLKVRGSVPASRQTLKALVERGLVNVQTPRPWQHDTTSTGVRFTVNGWTYVASHVEDVIELIAEHEGETTEAKPDMSSIVADGIWRHRHTGDLTCIAHEKQGTVRHRHLSEPFPWLLATSVFRKNYEFVAPSLDEAESLERNGTTYTPTERPFKLATFEELSELLDDDRMQIDEGDVRFQLMTIAVFLENGFELRWPGADFWWSLEEHEGNEPDAAFSWMCHDGSEFACVEHDGGHPAKTLLGLLIHIGGLEGVRDQLEDWSGMDLEDLTGELRAYDTVVGAHMDAGDVRAAFDRAIEEGRCYRMPFEPFGQSPAMCPECGRETWIGGKMTPDDVIEWDTAHHADGCPMAGQPYDEEQAYADTANGAYACVMTYTGAGSGVRRHRCLPDPQVEYVWLVELEYEPEAEMGTQAFLLNVREGVASVEEVELGEESRRMLDECNWSELRGDAPYADGEPPQSYYDELAETMPPHPEETPSHDTRHADGRDPENDTHLCQPPRHDDAAPQLPTENLLRDAANILADYLEEEELVSCLRARATRLELAKLEYERRAERPEVRHDDAATDSWERDHFIDYLEERLVPDLRDSGLFETANDFCTAIRLIREAAGLVPDVREPDVHLVGTCHASSCDGLRLEFSRRAGQREVIRFVDTGVEENRDVEVLCSPSRADYWRGWIDGVHSERLRKIRK